MRVPEPKITARTQLCGIVLHPAGHTRSPAMHNAPFAPLGIDAAYLAFDVQPDNLAEAIAGMRAIGIRQLAVSIPHKEAVMALLDEVDATARRIGAVNTVTRRDQKLVGTNTDWLGAVRAIERVVKPSGARAVGDPQEHILKAAPLRLVSQSFDLLAARQDPFACSYHAAISGVFQDASDERCQRFAGP